MKKVEGYLPTRSKFTKALFIFCSLTNEKILMSKKLSDCFVSNPKPGETSTEMATNDYGLAMWRYLKIVSP